MRRFYRLVPREFWLGMLTLGGVIVLDVLPGLIIGVVLSILLLVYQASRLPISVLGADPSVPGAYMDVRRHPEAQQVPGLLIVRPDGPLFMPMLNPSTTVSRPWCPLRPGPPIP